MSGRAEYADGTPARVGDVVTLRRSRRIGHEGSVVVHEVTYHHGVGGRIRWRDAKGQVWSTSTTSTRILSVQPALDIEDGEAWGEVWR